MICLHSCDAALGSVVCQGSASHHSHSSLWRFYSERLEVGSCWSPFVLDIVPPDSHHNHPDLEFIDDQPPLVLQGPRFQSVVELRSREPLLDTESWLAMSPVHMKENSQAQRQRPVNITDADLKVCIRLAIDKNVAGTLTSTPTLTQVMRC